jgi:mannan endo-1,4-beta-mannosidase
MFKNKILLLFVIVVLLATGILSLSAVHASSAAATIPVSFIVDTEHARATISPYIYGTNQDFSGYNSTLRRFGGNRTTGFNWETNASNAGSDYNQNSDDFACGWAGVASADCGTPGAVISAFHDKSLQMGAATLLTLQMAGYVAADKNGPVAASEVAPSARWHPVGFAKGSAFANPPDATDNAVYMDEEVNYLVQKYGLSTTATGVKMYSLDNEPALWPNTHPLIHPAIPTVNELMTKSIALSKAVKAVDPGVQIFGPAAYG